MTAFTSAGPAAPDRGGTWRLAVSVAVGVAVALLSCLCVWKQSRYNYSFDVEVVRSDLINLRHALKSHRALYGNLPGSLAELKATKGDTPSWPVNDAGLPLTPWGHPFEYRVDGDDFTLLSLGSDGVRGGDGLAADYDGLDTSPLPLPTMHEFAFALPTSGAKVSCAAAGLFAAAGAWVLLKHHSGVRVLSWSVVASLILTTGFAVVVAILMSLLYLPERH